MQVSKPSKILSVSALTEAWNSSRDRSRARGGDGVDHVTSAIFKRNLAANISAIHSEIKSGQFGYAPLRVIRIPKTNNDKFRIICVPTVRDRLVQRSICAYLENKRKFPIYNNSSFGFLKGVSTLKAIEAARSARSRGTWCFKTDIESFFDRIPRNYLKEEVRKKLGNSSLTKLVLDAIDCEAEAKPSVARTLAAQGIKRGEGVRQGMPLSPMLANLALARFDKEIERQAIRMVRYADDLVVFADSKDAAIAAGSVVTLLLQKLDLKIPNLGGNSKTIVRGPDDPLEFLGQEILYLDKSDAYVARISKAQIAKIVSSLKAEYSPSEIVREKLTLADVNIALSRTLSAYRGAYAHASNYQALDGQLRATTRAIIKDVLETIFGFEIVRNITPEGQQFLGIEGLHDQVEELLDDT
ncbi:hypothetical protein sos41_37070 [Alphaproteobacteria bacterium SO-S41]|nr:hypothetical protein sos41_37070 [Alphaproteobacteria bacterium SO-S41]